MIEKREMKVGLEVVMHPPEYDALKGKIIGMDDLWATIRWEDGETTTDFQDELQVSSFIRVWAD